ncbi:MAG: hypothetical protein U1D32_03040, partial [Patescibacteria group bacterium]|nr:hypothetical protein [Patescibacteria group bacterium]
EEPMNSFQLQELIKNVQTMMRCPSCGAHYTENHIHFLGQLDMAALIQLDCESCGLPVMATIVVSGKEQQTPKLLSDVSKEDLKGKHVKDPVTSDHVVDTHQFLKEFDGNFEKAFAGGGSGG